MKKLNRLPKMEMLKGASPRHIRLKSPGSAFTHDLQIDILDSIGKTIAAAPTFNVLQGNQECEVDLSAFPMGVYHLRMVDSSIFFIKRLILN